MLEANRHPIFSVYNLSFVSCRIMLLLLGVGGMSVVELLLLGVGMKLLLLLRVGVSNFGVESPLISLGEC